jgi:hypothetical protein
MLKVLTMFLLLRTYCILNNKLYMYVLKINMIKRITFKIVT